MKDQDTSIQDLKDVFRKFVDDRDWEQFHSPKNLAMSMACEAAELMEHFLWMENGDSRQAMKDPARLAEVGEEIADVAGHIFCLCNSLGIDLASTIQAKMEKNAEKYPAEKYRGRYQL